MRKVKQVKAQKSKVSIKRRILTATAKCIPVGMLRKVMEMKYSSIGIETTNICNANCSFCGYRFMQRPKVLMPWENYEAAIDSYASSGGGSINFTPTVGDPLVDKEIVKKIQYARSKKSIDHIFLFTNALFIDRIGPENIVKSGITRLAISTYIGSKEGYKKYYGATKYEKVMNNIVNVAKINKELNKPVNITLHLRVSQDETEWKESDYYKEIVKYVDESNISFLTEYDTWSGRIAVEDLPQGCTVVKPKTIEEKQKEPCFELFRRMHLLADGRVGACVCTDLEAEINIGDINKTKSLNKIWRGKKLKSYRDNWIKGDLPKVCQTCTRYTPISEYIQNNKEQIIINFIKRSYPFIYRKMVGNQNQREMSEVEF